MSRPRLERPTDVELEILQVLWRLDTGTVRDVHDELNKKREVAQTSVATMLQVMVDKGLAVRTCDRRPFKYKATSDQASTSNVMLADLTHRLFGGSFKRLLQHALTGKKSTPEQMAEINKLIDGMEEK